MSEPIDADADCFCCCHDVDDGDCPQRADLASLRSIASALADDVRVLARAGGVTAVSALEHVERWYEWSEAHRDGAKDNK